MRNVRKILLATLVVSGLALMSQAAQAENFALVVNAGNSYTADLPSMKNAMKRFYLKQQTTWPNGDPVEAFARVSDSAPHKAFSTTVLGMSQAEQDAHWAKLKQTIGETAPRDVDSSSILLRQIVRKKGSFGVLSSSEMADMPAEVKVLFKFD